MMTLEARTRIRRYIEKYNAPIKKEYRDEALYEAEQMELYKEERSKEL